MPKNITTHPNARPTRGGRPRGAAPDEPPAWQGTLAAAELVEVRVALLLRLGVAQANERGTHPHTAERAVCAQRVRTLEALLARLTQAEAAQVVVPEGSPAHG